VRRPTRRRSSPTKPSAVRRQIPLPADHNPIPVPKPLNPDGTRRWLVYADGASRGNPGPASIGAAVFDERGQEVARVSRRLGRATNNEVEYQAAIAGLEAALGLGGGEVELRMDSQLIVRQLEFRYKVRNPRLIPFFNRLLELKRQFSVFAVKHVPREQNTRADELANLALDRLEDDTA
jgi:ribonuclease HI